MYSKTRMTQWPSSSEASSRGAGISAGSLAETDASARYMAAWSGQAPISMALTKIILPSASVSREASPGENPPLELAAVTTPWPASCSTMALTVGGTCLHSRRLLLADGLLADTLPVALLQSEQLMRQPKGFGGCRHTGEVIAWTKSSANSSPRGRALCRTAYLLTGDWQVGEDLVQVALTRTYRRRRRLRSAEAHEPYARKVLVWPRA